MRNLVKAPWLRLSWALLLVCSPYIGLLSDNNGWYLMMLSNHAKWLIILGGLTVGALYILGLGSLCFLWKAE